MSPRDERRPPGTRLPAPLQSGERIEQTKVNAEDRTQSSILKVTAKGTVRTILLIEWHR